MLRLIRGMEGGSFESRGRVGKERDGTFFFGIPSLRLEDVTRRQGARVTVDSSYRGLPVPTEMDNSPLQVE